MRQLLGRGADAGVPGLIGALLIVYLRSPTAAPYPISTVILSYLSAPGPGWLVLHHRRDGGRDFLDAVVSIDGMRQPLRLAGQPGGFLYFFGALLKYASSSTPAISSHSAPRSSRSPIQPRCPT